MYTPGVPDRLAGGGDTADVAGLGSQRRCGDRPDAVVVCSAPAGHTAGPADDVAAGPVDSQTGIEPATLLHLEGASCPRGYCPQQATPLPIRGTSHSSSAAQIMCGESTGLGMGGSQIEPSACSAAARHRTRMTATRQ
jgi:hypothetical protein